MFRPRLSVSRDRSLEDLRNGTGCPGPARAYAKAIHAHAASAAEPVLGLLYPIRRHLPTPADLSDMSNTPSTFAQ
jgi:hypothetical protein